MRGYGQTEMMRYDEDITFPSLVVDGNIVIFPLDEESMSLEGVRQIHCVVAEAECDCIPIWFVLDMRDIPWVPKAVHAYDFGRSLMLLDSHYVKGVVAVLTDMRSIKLIQSAHRGAGRNVVSHITNSITGALSWIRAHDDQVFEVVDTIGYFDAIS